MSASVHDQSESLVVLLRNLEKLEKLPNAGLYHQRQLLRKNNELCIFLIAPASFHSQLGLTIPFFLPPPLQKELHYLYGLLYQSCSEGQ